MPSFVVKKERCPSCAKLGKDNKGDNLAVYNDGHKWCFSCGYYVSGDVVYKIRAALTKEEPVKELKILPDDIVPCSYGEGYQWLKKYGLSNIEIMQYRIMWSPSKQWLIFPQFDETGSVSVWQARNFNPDKPYKYYTQGNVKDSIWLFGTGEHPITLVEDIVSAIKVGRHGIGMPLLGSVISTSLLLRLKLLNKPINIWLDPDKQKEMVKFSSTALRYGLSVRTIFTDMDPKDYDDESLRSILYS